MADPVVTPAVPATPVKPGYLTTEFWLSIVGAISGILVLLGYLSPEEAGAVSGNVTSVVGGVLSVGSIAVYAWTRAKTKGSSIDVATILGALGNFGKK